MKRHNSKSRKTRASRRKTKHGSRPRSHEQTKKANRGPSRRQQAEKVRVLAAVNRVRRRTAGNRLRGRSGAEGTTLPTMRRVAPDALVQDRPGGRIRVKRTDRYSAEVQILTLEGALA